MKSTKDISTLQDINFDMSVLAKYVKILLVLSSSTSLSLFRRMLWRD